MTKNVFGVYGDGESIEFTLEGNGYIPSDNNLKMIFSFFKEVLNRETFFYSIFEEIE